ncbi:MAG TPA: DMT family transporter [Solirubrobacteraceae bacterium]
MIALFLALSASTCWGASDFLAGLKSRTTALIVVLLTSQVAGLAALLVAVTALDEPPPAERFLLLAALAGVVNVAALGAFYRGLAVSPMGVVAPIAACDAIVPVIGGTATGDAPTALAGAGILLAIGGVVLASRGGDEDGAASASRGGIALAIVAALCFGVFVLALDAASDGGVLWAVLVSRASSVTVLIVAALIACRGAPPTRREDMRALVTIGALDVSATVLFAFAATQGLISRVGVLGSLYPIVTILLARVVLREQLDRLQTAGAAGALVGAIMLAAAAT